MPNDHQYRAPSDIDTRIYRQIIVVLALRDPKEFREFHEKLIGFLKDVKYRFVGEPIPDLGLVAIEVDLSEDVPGLLDRLNAVQDLVRSAEQNRPIRLTQALVPPVDDPLYWDQWALRKIAAECAWERARAAAVPPVIVGIVDSGISTTHPDLAGHLWNGSGGHHGHNVLTNTSDVWDSRGHGTLLAGTIGAISNNALGIAGAEWPIQLMAVKFIDERTSPDTWNGLQAIWWAFLNGAKVINLAWDLGLPNGSLRTALVWMIQSLNTVVFVAGAGNDGLDNDELPTLPASFPASNLISVMASDEEDDKPGFSNYGATTVHLAAPGIRILSTASYFLGPQWRQYTGTSAACAHVTGAAALLRALNPAVPAAQIRQHLMASVDKSRWLKCVSHGRLNLGRAVCGPLQINAPAKATNWPQGTPNNPVTWTNMYATPLCTSVRVLLSEGGGPFNVLTAGRPNTGVCQVAAPPRNIPNARLRLQSEQAPGLYAESDVFTVS